MRSILFSFVLFFSCGIFSLHAAEPFPANRALKTLLDSGEYFRFYQEYSKLEMQTTASKGFDVPYFNAWRDFLLNKPFDSNGHIESLLQSPKFNCPDSAAADLLQLHLQNDMRLFHYRVADSICNLLLFRYPSVMSAKGIADIKNTASVVSALKEVPPQTIQRIGELDILYKRDLASLVRVPVTINKQVGNYIIDTGANLSTVSESEAQKMGVRILDAKFGVTSSSRASVDSKLGIADKIEIGNVVFRNVVFIVLPDKSLKFAGGVYKITGIIGFPVIAQLGEIEIHKNGHFISPSQQTESLTHNLLLVGNTPIANVGFYGQEHPYIFDTGAGAGILGPKFRAAYSDSLKKAKTSSSRIGGAGGTQKISVLKISELQYEFCGVKGVLKHSTIELSGNEEVLSTFYGIVGEDIFKTWDVMSVNFDQMFVKLQ